MSGAATWCSTAEGVELACGPLRGVLEADALADGLRSITWDGVAVLDRLFAAAAPKGPLAGAAESYVRGDDHVSTHPATMAFPFRTQLDWSAHPLTSASGGVAVTVNVSLQTDLLDTHPGLALATEADGEGVAGLKHAWRLAASGGVTVAVAAHPSDAAETESTTLEGTTVLRLLPPFLEKGVIRRCRVAAFFLPGAATDASIAEAVSEFADLPLPLTT